jgi:hypothetical protein
VGDGGRKWSDHGELRFLSVVGFSFFWVWWCRVVWVWVWVPRHGFVSAFAGDCGGSGAGRSQARATTPC